MTQWIVEVIEKATGNIVKSLGPHESKKSDRIADGIRANLDRKKFYVTQKPHEVSEANRQRRSDALVQHSRRQIRKERGGEMKTKIEGITLSDKFPSGALVGNIDASYKELEALLGPPNGEPSGDGKVSTEWVLEHNGQVFSLYDYKETNLYDSDLPSVEAFRAQPSYCWHIGGHAVGIEGHRAREGFVERLQRALRVLREKVQESTAATRKELLVAMRTRLGAIVKNAKRYPYERQLDVAQVGINHLFDELLKNS